MGGRGSSGVITRGGRTYTRVTIPGGGGGGAQQNVANQAPTPQNTPVVTDAVKKLSKMTDDELATLYNQSKTVDMPNHLKDASDRTQKFVFAAGINEKPEVLDKKAFDKYLKDNGIPRRDILARSTGGAHYTVNGTTINLSPAQVSSLIKDGDLTYVGGKHGGQAYGAGTYFDRNGGHNTGYSSGTTMTAVLSKKANKITDLALQRQVSSFQRSHPKFAKAVGAYSTSSMSIYALAMGYNVITDTMNSYHNVIDRAALVMREDDI